MSLTPEHVETDPRFPSGRWVGFWIQKALPPGRFETELLLTFRQGIFNGEGRDWVGKYTVQGRYDLQDGRCHWTKTYLGKHKVFYQGFNEGKGIWGVWVIPSRDPTATLHGGFHIWPVGMADPTNSHLSEEADLPIVIEEKPKVAEPIGAPR